jgi:hypothetical protein
MVWFWLVQQALYSRLSLERFWSPRLTAKIPWNQMDPFCSITLMFLWATQEWFTTAMS